MKYRLTNADKWSDIWFTSLKPAQMLLFMYLCDNCDNAGFIELNYRRWASDLATTQDAVKSSLMGLNKGITPSKDGTCIYLNNFLKHQKNYPINAINKAHIQIIRIFEFYADKFGIDDISKFIEGAMKGVLSPTGNIIGIGEGHETICKKQKVVLTETTDEDKNHPMYQGFVDYGDWLVSDGLNLAKLREQLTFAQYKKLVTKFGVDAVVAIFKVMNNYKPLTQKCISVYLTANNWLSRDQKSSR